ncbi:MAG: NAD(P)-dependent alcohol dehydrogenase [Solirubrobacteraceae bacterium]|nr:NAD(P)-dependent alcohol dehydrogenase [Solirubrobacteraceae bacterium]
MATSLPARGWAAQAADAELAPISFARRAPHPQDVVIDIEWCGICHSDLHTARNEWHNTVYPALPGHEIVGKVREVGAEVAGFAVGDTVGVGCIVDSCRECASCKEGQEQYCPRGTYTYNSPDPDFEHATFGGYSSTIVVDQRFVLSIPDTLDPAAAAPILCAGITMWSPLTLYGAGHGTKVGIAGFGGLGSMGIKLAKALGAEVVAITRSAAKAEHARAAGADDVLVSSDPAELKRFRGKLDLIVDTIPVGHPVDPYLKLLGTGGALVIVGAIEPLSDGVDARLLVQRRRTLTGSLIGGLPETQKLLDFCGAHGITSDIEKIPVTEINAAYERMAAGQLDFRYVIDMSTLAP